MEIIAGWCSNCLFTVARPVCMDINCAENNTSLENKKHAHCGVCKLRLAPDRLIEEAHNSR